MLGTQYKLIYSLVTKTISFTRVISITIEMPIAMAIIKNLYQS
jgi:hypothetical protein